MTRGSQMVRLTYDERIRIFSILIKPNHYIEHFDFELVEMQTKSTPQSLKQRRAESAKY